MAEVEVFLKLTARAVYYCCRAAGWGDADARRLAPFVTAAMASLLAADI
jgi:hypothetical protein